MSALRCPDRGGLGTGSLRWSIELVSHKLCVYTPARSSGAPPVGPREAAEPEALRQGA